MTLEERVERLEDFAGDIDKIISVYANSVQEICDKYLNLLYIETYDSTRPNYLTIDGFLSELSTISSIPRNVMFNVRPSHTFAYKYTATTDTTFTEGKSYYVKSGSTYTEYTGTRTGNPSALSLYECESASKIKFKRTDATTQTTVELEIPLKKYDVTNPGTLVFLSPGDYISGMLYGIYVDSQGIAVISSNDTGSLALQQVTALATTVSSLQATVQQMTSTQTVGSIAVTTGTIANLTVSTALTLTNAFTIPTGTTCSTPSNDTEVANKSYVDTTIDSKISTWFDNHHKFGTGTPESELSTAENKTIYFRYTA